MEDYIKILLGLVLFGLAAATGRPALMIVILGIFVTILYYLSMNYLTYIMDYLDNIIN